MRINLNQYNRESGFTLVEMLTVLFIMTLMSGLVFANYHSGSQRFVLETDAYRLAQDLRRAQEMAMSSKEIGVSTPAGYGIYLEAGDLGYKIYADTTVPANNMYDPGDYTVEDVVFSKYIYIVSINPDQLSVNYIMPDPDTVLTDGAGVEVSEASIVIGMQGSSNTRTVKVNSGGLIYVE